MFADGVFHLRDFGEIRARFVGETAMLGNLGEFATCEHKQTSDKDRFGDFAVLVGGGLEGLARRIGEAIQVEAIVPIGTADQRQTMGAETLERVMEAALEMLVERRFGAGYVVVGHRLVEDAPVAGFLNIGANADDQPVGIVVEAAADVVVAALGERLVLVISATGGKLRCGEVEYAFARAAGNHVDKAEQILVGIAEAEAASDARFVERGRARHVERGHALVGIPDVHHAIGVHVGRVHLEEAEQFIPVLTKLFEGGVGIGRRRDTSRSLPSRLSC